MMTNRLVPILCMAFVLMGAATGVRIATESPLTGGPFSNSGSIGCPTCVTGPSASPTGGIPTYADTSGRRLGETPILMTSTIGTPGSDTALPTEKAVRTLFGTAGGGGSTGGLCQVTPSATPVFDAQHCTTFTLALGATPVTGSTLINVPPGATVTFFITQDATGGRPFFWPPNLWHACLIAQSPTVTTVVTGTSDGTIVFAKGCTTSLPATFLSGPMRGQPPNPPAGYLTCWFDEGTPARGTAKATQPGFKCVDPAGQVTGGGETPSGGGARYADAEVPEGAIDGLNATFRLAHTPNPPTSLLLNHNGLTMKPGLDFNLTGADIVFLAEAIPKNAGAPDTLVAWYRY